MNNNEPARLIDRIGNTILDILELEVETKQKGERTLQLLSGIWVSDEKFGGRQ